jgi:hypothetical protein
MLHSWWEGQTLGDLVSVAPGSLGIVAEIDAMENGQKPNVRVLIVSFQENEFLHKFSSLNKTGHAGKKRYTSEFSQ